MGRLDEEDSWVLLGSESCLSDLRARGAGTGRPEESV